MTDRVLLEKAAKAAGIPIDRWYESAEAFYCPTHRIETCWWNPLTDDGDALRLAVKLEMDLWIGYGGTDVESAKVKTITQLTINDDPCAATRLAIVRAAAEIGRNMK